jgi:hypothetical protein
VLDLLQMRRSSFGRWQELLRARVGSTMLGIEDRVDYCKEFRHAFSNMSSISFKRSKDNVFSLESQTDLETLVLLNHG